ncbi:MAG: hypothetical protein A2Y14_02655 [Verrucomicrobia bacterium GWF2_51_19]|nr:MAG: hypothetical protein A2Y14_02655 [Verrucomicrobia bacterium GWF2_51_19]
MKTYSPTHPFWATMTKKQRLNPSAGEKETVHFELDMSGSDLNYEAGDILGVIPSNDPKEVNDLIQALRLTGSEPILWGKEQEPMTLRCAFEHRCCLRFVPHSILVKLLERLGNASEKKSLKILFDPACSESLKNFQNNHSMFDVAEKFSSASFEPQEYVDCLKRLTPRLYSIASSPRNNANQIDLVVSIVRYHLNERMYGGVASTFLADRVPFNIPAVPVFIAKSSFRLPENTDTDVIMVGPGAGLAPFRGFLQERDLSHSKGRNWLFFGDQHRASDFLYENELNAYLEKGLLTRLDLAFSRDQVYKIYVQHKMKENAQELWNWIQNDAHFYVCGDASRMAKDVEETLLEMFKKQGHMSEDAAAAYLKDMRTSKRYQKDVY